MGSSEAGRRSAHYKGSDAFALSLDRLSPLCDVGHASRCLTTHARGKFPSGKSLLQHSPPRLFSFPEDKKALRLMKFSSSEDKKGLPMEQFSFPEELFRLPEELLAITEELFSVPEEKLAIRE